MAVFLQKNNSSGHLEIEVCHAIKSSIDGCILLFSSLYICAFDSSGKKVFNDAENATYEELVRAT